MTNASATVLNMSGRVQASGCFGLSKLRTGAKGGHGHIAPSPIHAAEVGLN